MSLKIVQVLPSMSFGDAVSNHALSIHKYCLSKGLHASIMALDIDEKSRSICEFWDNKLLHKDTVLIYHMAIGSSLSDHFKSHLGRKVLVYHNITPSRYYELYDMRFSKTLDSGRDEVKSLAQASDCTLTVSDYNSKELAAYGFKNVYYVPLDVRLTESKVPFDFSNFSQKKKSLLFVGRVAPHKKQDDLIRLMAYYNVINPHSHLTLVGGYHEDDLYYQSLRKLVSQYSLDSVVDFTGKVSDEKLHQYYTQSDVFVSMSEHEGFGIPLMEAISYDKLVLAFSGSSVKDTVGCGGVLFDSKSNFPQLACLLEAILKNKSFLLEMQSLRSKRIMEFKQKSFLYCLNEIWPQVIAID